MRSWIPLIPGAMIITSGCAPVPFSAARTSAAQVVEVAGRTELHSKPIEYRGRSLGLRVVESVDLPGRYIDMIAEFYPYSGSARLDGDGCIQFIGRPGGSDGQPDPGLIGARVALDPLLCEDLPSRGNASAALPCNRDARGSLLGGWRLTCVHLPRGRSALVAVGDAPATKGRKITLVEVDQHIRFFNLFAIHPPTGEVTTLGTRSDGKTVISKYMWHSRNTEAGPEIKD